MNFFAMMLAVACLFNTVFGMTLTDQEQKQARDQANNIFVYFEDEVDLRKEKDLIKLTVNLTGNDRYEVIQFQYALGVGMVHTPCRTNSKLDSQGVVSFYCIDGACDSEIVPYSSNPYKYQATGYLYVRAEWDIEHKLQAMLQPNFANIENNKKYTRLLEQLMEQIREQRKRA